MSNNFIEGGGTFIDYRNPKKIFKTTNIEEWNAHLKKTDATVTGTAPCALCSSTVELKDHKYGNKIVCDSCKKEISKK